MEHILVIDDDIHVGNVIEELLIKDGYRVSRAYSGTEAVLYLGSHKPDLILLDLMLPGLKGEDLLPMIKGIPVIVVSAKADVSDKVSMLLGGASDYITKPFNSRELLARIKVQLRKASIPYNKETLVFDDIVIDPASRSVSVKNTPLRLTKTEYAILKLLMENPAQVITKSLLLDRISEDTPDCMESSLKVHISNLRRKLREAGQKEYIESVWGVGFKMKEE